MNPEGELYAPQFDSNRPAIQEAITFLDEIPVPQGQQKLGAGLLAMANADNGRAVDNITNIARFLRDNNEAGNEHIQSARAILTAAVKTQNDNGDFLKTTAFSAITEHFGGTRATYQNGEPVSSALVEHMVKGGAAADDIRRVFDNHNSMTALQELPATDATLLLLQATEAALSNKRGVGRSPLLPGGGQGKEGADTMGAYAFLEENPEYARGMLAAIRKSSEAPELVGQLSQIAENVNAATRKKSLV